MTTDANPPETFWNAHANAMRQFREKTENLNGVALKIRAKTQAIIQFVMLLLVFLAILIAYQIQNMTTEMTYMVSNMVEMQTKFDAMSNNLHTITQSVVTIRQDMRGMPVIHLQLSNTNNDLVNIKGAVVNLAGALTRMDEDILLINQGMYGMANAFDRVNFNMYQIDRNVNHISRPTNLMNPFNGITPP